MKAGVETSDLWNTGQALNDRFDSGEVVGLMKRRERDQFVQFFEHLLVYYCWAFKLCATVNHAMAHAEHSRSGILRTQPHRERFDCFVAVRTLNVLFRETLIVGVFNRQPWRGADTFNLPTRREPPRIARRTLKHAELQTR